MTTLTTPAPVPTEPGSSEQLRFVAVRVNLLPTEIAAGRRTDALKRHVLTGLAALVAVIVLGFGISWWQTHSAESGLRDAQSAQAELQQQSRKYAPLVTAKSDTAAIKTQLRSLMAGDVAWNQLLRTVRATATRGITVESIDGTVGTAGTAPTAGTSGADAAAGTGVLTLTGTARDKLSVADFADALSRVRGLGSAQPTNTATADGRTQWTITVPLTPEAQRARTAGGQR